MSIKNLKIALVFDWMTSSGGAAKVDLVLHQMFPKAPIYTSIYNEKNLPEFKKAKIVTSFIQNLPFAKDKHQIYLDLMPYAYELFDLSEFDIVISSSHSCSKGIITKPETLHLSYCHSPMRYAWDNWHNYINDYKMNPIIKKIGKRKLHKIRMWDRLSADRVDYFVANSNTTKNRIKKYYSRDSKVIFPMIEADKYNISHKPKEYYFAAGRMTPYKKFDLIVDAFNKNGLPIKIAGTGISYEELKKKANSNIEFLGFVKNSELIDLYANAKALIFPQLEDFGITPLESMASGRPVIAYNKGGALDTVIENKTGIFFNKQTVTSLNKAIEKYENKLKTFSPKEIREHAKTFDTENFQKQIKEYIEECWIDWKKVMNF